MTTGRTRQVRDEGRGVALTDQELGSAQPPTGTAAATMAGFARDRYDREPVRVLRVARFPVPALAGGQVLVQVHAAGVDRGTCHVMAGLRYRIRLAGFGLRQPRYWNPGRQGRGRRRRRERLFAG
jgi:hypothetical protein